MEDYTTMLPYIRDFPVLNPKGLDSLFSDLWPTEFSVPSPHLRLDIKENEAQFTVLADLPGVRKENISLDLKNNRLEIIVSASQEEKDEKFVLRERKATSFRRVFYLGENVDSDNINAKLENGVLTIDIPKVKPNLKRIEVK